jgi:hypothetical protein
MVEPEERSPRIFGIGPACRDITDALGTTVTALKVFLTSQHPKMPDPHTEETADVAAYILRLRDHR